MSFWKQNCDLWGNDIPWLEGLREKGLRAFEKCGFPTKKTEAWKFSAVNEADFHNPIIDCNEHLCECGGEKNCCCTKKNNLPFEVYNLKFCNGKVSTEEFNFVDGLMIKPLIEAIFDGDAKKFLNKNVEPDKFPFATLNTAYLEQGLMIVVEKNTVLDKPIYLNYHNHGEKNLWCNIRNLIVMENNTQATIIEHFNAEHDGEYFNNIVNEIFVGNDACLQHYKLQNESKTAHHIALNSVTVKTNGTYKAFCGQKECALARNETYVELQGEGAQACVNGAYKINKSGLLDTTTNINHASAHTFSNQLVKGVVNGTGKGVFQGQIHIAPNAQKTEGYQLHRALLLCDTAEVDCKPELEIFADDVKCSHGATSGDLDKEQLFYMQSRGISLDGAKQILINAYLNEALEKIDNPAIKEWISENLY